MYQEDVKRQTIHIHETTRKFLLEGAATPPRFIGYNDDELHCAVLMRPTDSKEEQRAAEYEIARFLTSCDLNYIGYASDAYYRILPGTELGLDKDASVDEAHKAYNESNFPAPREDPEAREALITLGMTYQHAYSILHPYGRTDEGQLKFEEPQQDFVEEVSSPVADLMKRVLNKDISPFPQPLPTLVRYMEMRGYVIMLNDKLV